MNFAEITRDEATFLQWRRRAFPFFEHKICLTHASVSPLPRVVAEAGFRVLVAHHARRPVRFRARPYLPALQRARGESHRQRRDRDEVAFCGSTSHAIGTVATGIQWQSGDNCVVADGDFPANVVPWKNLQHRHDIEVRMIPYRPHMNITLDDIKPL
jgi:selenocysteine lyase/cysteine desulfurase